MKRFFFLFMILSAVLAWGHGEDKPGPNNGFIRMPGAFHTEIVPLGSNQFKVFLLDIQWKNPSVKESSLDFAYQGKRKIKAACEKKDNFYFLCTFPKGVDLNKKGKLFLVGQRESQKGMEVSYELPLKHVPVNADHSGH